MKKWNTPEIAELNINETANGRLDAFVETKYAFNDNITEAIEDFFNKSEEDSTTPDDNTTDIMS